MAHNLTKLKSNSQNQILGEVAREMFIIADGVLEVIGYFCLSLYSMYLIV